MAGSASQSKNGGIARKVLIVLDCIIMRLDRGMVRTVTHDSVFIQSRAVGGAGGGVAVVALAGGDDGEVPGRA
jgi:hypothetical protein